MTTNSRSDLVGMTFNMPPEWHTEFKGAAIAKGTSMHALLEEAFEAWKLVESLRQDLLDFDKRRLPRRKLKRA